MDAAPPATSTDAAPTARLLPQEVAVGGIPGDLWPFIHRLVQLYRRPSGDLLIGSLDAFLSQLIAVELPERRRKSA